MQNTFIMEVTNAKPVYQPRIKNKESIFSNSTKNGTGQNISKYQNNRSQIDLATPNY